MNQVGARDHVRVKLILKRVGIFHRAVIEIKHAVVKMEGAVPFLYVEAIPVKNRILDAFPRDVHEHRSARSHKNMLISKKFRRADKSRIAVQDNQPLLAIHLDKRFLIRVLKSRTRRDTITMPSSVPPKSA